MARTAVARRPVEVEPEFGKVALAIRMDEDIRSVLDSAETLSQSEARYLVDLYYQVQEYRIRAQGQARAAVEDEEPHHVVRYVLRVMEALEHDVAKALARYALASELGTWAMSICGIGPVLAAGLCAHLNVERAPTVGHWWRFAGLDPTQEWNKGQKRPYNARLKVLCWKVGQSFLKVHNRESDVYGHLYYERKLKEIAKNEAGEFADQAAEKLRRFKIQDKATRSVYESGKLPAGHIDARARRWAVKLFLAHLHAVAYQLHYGKPAPKPYVLSILGHADEIQVPNWPF